MGRHVQLNNAEHQNLRVRMEKTASLGDAVMSAPVFPHEFRRAQAHYPVVFSKEAATGRFRPVCLFGLETGENLFLDEKGWDAPFVPAAMRMPPFLIGRGQGGELEVHIELDHPRVDEAGEPLFLEHGGQAPLLQEVSSVLGEVAAGDQEATAFCATLTELELLEPFTLDVTLDDGSTGRLAGLYVIAEERLAGLEGSALERLQKADALMPVFMAVASLSRLEDLAARRNARLAAP